MYVISIQSVKDLYLECEIDFTLPPKTKPKKPRHVLRLSDSDSDHDGQPLQGHANPHPVPPPQPNLDSDSDVASNLANSDDGEWESLSELSD